jgi:hypothetical protein
MNSLIRRSDMQKRTGFLVMTVMTLGLTLPSRSIYARQHMGQASEWQIDPVQRERKHVALLNRGFRLKDLSAFITVISEVAR